VVPYKLHSGGKEYWEYLNESPAREALFSAAMTNIDAIGERQKWMLGGGGGGSGSFK